MNRKLLASQVEEDPLGLSGFTDKYELALELCDVRLMLEPDIAALASVRASDATIETHRAITDAILRGDSAGARYAMITHLNYNRQMILKLKQEQSCV